MSGYECGYCGGPVVETETGWVHTTDGERVRVYPGDYVSGRHNRAGTRVHAGEVFESDNNEKESNSVQA